MSVNFLKFYCNTSLKMNTFWLLKDHVIIITDKKKFFITKPQLKSHLQSTYCYKNLINSSKTLSTIPSVTKETPRPSLENKNNPIYNK